MQTYRRFLEGIYMSLVQALTEAEDEGWHHAKAGPLYNHYQRLLTWYREVDERRQWYDHA